MTNRGTDRVASALRLSRRIAVGVMAMAAVVILGWILDVRILKGFLPGTFSMKVNSALGFVLAGYGVCRMAREHPSPRQAALGTACAAVVCALGTLTILEHTTGMDFGIDQALAVDAREDGNPGAPGRMASSTALNFLLVGVALLSLAAQRRPFRILGQSAVVLAAVVSLVGMTADLLEATLFLPGHSYMALHTAAGFFALCIALLWARPEGGFMDVIMAEHAGAVATRRLLPIVVVVPVLIGWLRLEGQRAGLYDTATGTLLFTCSVACPGPSRFPPRSRRPSGPPCAAHRA